MSEKQDTPLNNHGNITRKTWQEFRDTVLFLMMNSFLHIFGWTIVVQLEDGEIIDVYPARTKFRGFTEKSMDFSYFQITKYMKDNAKDLYKNWEQ